MLNIYFGDMPQAIYNTAVYFKNTYEDSWITDELSREMILDIDKSSSSYGFWKPEVSDSHFKYGSGCA